MKLEEIRQRLDELSEEMRSLIVRFGLRAESPLQVLEEAKRRISEPEAYVRFLELSLEGRILADEGERLRNAPVSQTQDL